MPTLKSLDDAALAAFAKQCRERAGKNRAEAARELGVSRPAIFYAEEHPDKGFQSLRKKIVELYSHYTVEGPVYVLKKR